MDKADHGSHRDRMRDQCAAIAALLSKHDRISISEIGDTLGMPLHTVRRWLKSFARAMDLRVEMGIVLIERN